MEAEEEAFREEVERLAGLSDGQTMLCVASDFNAGAPGRTVLRTDGVLLGKYDIINK